MLDQSAGIVEQQLARQAAEVAECALDPLQPSRLVLVPERRRIDPARVAQRGHEQEHFARFAIDCDPALAEVDLQLAARRGFEPHRRQRLGRQLAPQVRQGLFHRAQAHHDAQFRCNSWRNTYASNTSYVAY